ncbi:MAG: hypothetical protein AAF483_15080 [Planctomycetota bacterium]
MTQTISVVYFEDTRVKQDRLKQIIGVVNERLAGSQIRIDTPQCTDPVARKLDADQVVELFKQSLAPYTIRLIDVNLPDEPYVKAAAAIAEDRESRKEHFYNVLPKDFRGPAYSLFISLLSEYTARNLPVHVASSVKYQEVTPLEDERDIELVSIPEDKGAPIPEATYRKLEKAARLLACDWRDFLALELNHDKIDTATKDSDLAEMLSCLLNCSVADLCTETEKGIVLSENLQDWLKEVFDPNSDGLSVGAVWLLMAIVTRGRNCELKSVLSSKPPELLAIERFDDEKEFKQTLSRFCEFLAWLGNCETEIRLDQSSVSIRASEPESTERLRQNLAELVAKLMEVIPSPGKEGSASAVTNHEGTRLLLRFIIGAVGWATAPGEEPDKLWIGASAQVTRFEIRDPGSPGVVVGFFGNE